MMDPIKQIQADTLALYNKQVKITLYTSLSLFVCGLIAGFCFGLCF